MGKIIRLPVNVFKRIMELKSKKDSLEEKLSELEEDYKNTIRNYRTTKSKLIINIKGIDKELNKLLNEYGIAED